MKMMVYEEPDQCRLIWEKAWPVNGLFDLWQVRSCFQDSFLQPLRFHTIEQHNKIIGFLPLCWSDEAGGYVQFPGETWRGKTWLEQNRMIATRPEVLQDLMDMVPGSVHLRYLNWSELFAGLEQVTEDEVGYLFYPGMYDFSFDQYWLCFSGKSRKKLKKELNDIQTRQVAYRFNHIPDLEHLFLMNINSFCENSYFTDDRFYRAFENLASFLWKMGMLRITTVLVDDQIAAVDMGAIFKNTYTLLAGATSPQVHGIAKVINLHHMEWACHQKFDCVDFLCGDFNWKKRFHLTPRPLYELRLDRAGHFCDRVLHEQHAVCA